MPHEVNCMARWGKKSGKLRIQIIVGSGAKVHPDTVESLSIWTLLSPIPQVSGGGEYSLPYSLFK
jgi:hypothetical protein